MSVRALFSFSASRDGKLRAGLYGVFLWPRRREIPIRVFSRARVAVRIQLEPLSHSPSPPNGLSMNLSE